MSKIMVVEDDEVLRGELVLRQVRKESDISGNGAVLTGDSTLKYRDAVVNPAKGTISLNDNALTVNISRLRAKLSDFRYTEAIETRKKQGYCLVY